MAALKRRNSAEEASTDRGDAKNLLTREWVIGKLMANVERAMQATPVLDKWGEPTGEYLYEGSITKRWSCSARKSECSGTPSHQSRSRAR
jgi:hypothetical protein